MIDKLTEAVARSDAAFDGRPFDELGRADKERHLGRAKMSVMLTLNMLEKPTPGMIEAGLIALCNSADHTYDSDVISVFTAMIDAAMDKSS